MRAALEPTIPSKHPQTSSSLMFPFYPRPGSPLCWLRRSRGNNDYSIIETSEPAFNKRRKAAKRTRSRGASVASGTADSSVFPMPFPRGSSISILFPRPGDIRLRIQPPGKSVKMDDIALKASDRVLEVIFSYLDLPTLRNCSLVCKKWYRFLNDENNDVWRMHCIRRLAQEVLSSDLLSSVPTYKEKLRAFYHAWNPNDCSRNLYVKPNGFTVHRNPVAQSTDACRGKIGFRHGRHAWEVIWEGPLGTVAVIGIATKEASLLCHGYVALLGSDEHSWGWNLVDNHLLHNGDAQGNYPLLNNAPKYQVGERIRVILDCDDNTLSFEKNYEFLGVAFRGLPDKKLYPSVSAVYGNTEVSMVYLGRPLDG